MQEEKAMLDEIDDEQKYLGDLLSAEQELQIYRNIIIDSQANHTELLSSTRTLLAVGIRRSLTQVGATIPSVTMESLGSDISLESLDDNLKKVWEGIKKTAAAVWQKIKDFIKWLGNKILNAFFILIRERALAWGEDNYQVRRGDLNDYFDPNKPIPKDWDKQLVTMVTGFDTWALDYMNHLTDDVERMGSRLRLSLNTPSESIVDKQVISIVTQARKNVNVIQQKAKLGQYTIEVSDADFNDRDPRSVYRAYAQMVPKFHRPPYHEAPLKNAHAVLIRGEDMRNMTEVLAKEVEGMVKELNDTMNQLDNNFKRIVSLSPHYDERTTDHNQDVLACVRYLTSCITGGVSDLSKIPMAIIKDVTNIIEKAKSLNEDGGTHS